MSAAKHTPGPWYSPNDNGQIYSQTDRRNPVVDVYGAHNRDRDEDETLANVNLIAAAPEMLAACEAAYRWLNTLGEDSGSRSKVLAEIRAAIAKAKGGGL